MLSYRLVAAGLLLALCLPGFGAEGQTLGSVGTHTLRYFGEEGAIRHTAQSAYAIVMDGERYGLRMTRPDEAQEVKMTAISNFTEVYESLQSISRGREAGQPVVPARAASHMVPGVIPSKFRDLGVLQAVALACAVTARPEACVQGDALKPGLVPTHVAWSVNNLSTVGLDVASVVTRDPAGAIVRIDFNIALKVAGIERLKNASARGPLSATLASIEIVAREGRMPTHIVYTKYAGSAGGIRSQYELKGALVAEPDMTVLTAIAPTPGVDASFTDHRFPPTRFGYLLQAGDELPFSGSPAYGRSVQTRNLRIAARERAGERE